MKFSYLIGIYALLVSSLIFQAADAQPIDEISIAYNVGNPPLKFQDEKGEASGILMDLWRLWAKKTNIKITFKEALFSDTLEMVKNGDADIHAGLFYSEKRDQFLDYSEGIIDISYHIFYHKSITSKVTLAELTPFKIGVPKGYTETFVREHLPSAILEVYDNFPKLYNAAVKKEILVFLSPAMNLEYYFTQKGIDNEFRYDPAKPVYTRTYFGAVKEGNSALLKKIVDGFGLISAKERVETERKWLKMTTGTDKDTYIIAMDSNYAPITMLNDQGKPAGLFVDIWNTWATKEGVSVKYLFDDLKGSIQSVEEGLADFHSGYENSSAWAVSSRPFYQLKADIFYPAETWVESIENFYGKTIGVTDPFYSRTLMEAHPSIRTMLLANYADLFRKLNNGTIDAFFDDVIAVTDLLTRKGQQGEYKHSGLFVYDAPISAVLRKGRGSLLKRIEGGLNKISLEEFKRMEARWLINPQHGYYHKKTKNLNLSQKEWDWLKSHQTIRVGVDADFAPYSFRDEEGHYHGIAMEFADYIRRQLGIRLKVIDGLSWSEIVVGLRERRLDLTLTMSHFPEREKYVNFTEIYLPTPLVIMRRSRDRSISSEADIEGHTIALVEGYASSVRVMEEHPDVKPLMVKTALEGLLAVATGEADAHVGVLGINLYLIKKNNIANLEVASLYGAGLNGQRFGVRKDWPELAVILDKLLNITSIEEKRRFSEKWLPAAALVKPFPDQTEFTIEEQEWLKAHPQIRIGVNNSWPPMDYIDQDGKPQGIGVDFIRAMNKRLNNRLKIVPGAWNQIYDDVKEKRLDALADITPRPDREPFFYFTQPYLTVPHVIIAREDTGPGLKGLEGKTVGVERGFFIVNVINDKYPKIKVKEYDTTSDALHAAASGETDAYVGNRAVAMYLINQELISNLKVYDKIKETVSINAFGVRKDWPLLLSILQKTLNSLTENEKIKIFGKWAEAKGPRIKLSQKEINWLRAHPKLRLGYDKALPPLEYRDAKGNFVGIAADYMQYIEKLLNIEIEPVKTDTWGDALKAVKTGELDLISAVADTPERRKFLDFTRPYFGFPLVIVTSEDVPYLSKMDQLDGQKVSVVSDYVSHDLLKKNHSNYKLVPVTDVKSGLLQVASGKASAFIGSMATISHAIGQEGITGVKISGETPYHFEVSVGTRKDMPTLAVLMQKALDSISKEEHNAIHRKWLSVTFEQHVDYGLLWRTAGGFVLLIMAALFWVRFLAKQKRVVQIAKLNAEEAVRDLRNEIVVRKKSGKSSRGGQQDKEHFSFQHVA